MNITEEKILNSQLSIELYNARQMSGMSAKSVAEISGKSLSTYNSWEKGKSSPTISQLISVYKANRCAMLRPMLNYVYPSVFAHLKHDSDVSDVRSSLLFYFQNVAGDKELRYLHFLIFGEHGSLWRYQLEVFLANVICPMANRLSATQAIYDNFVGAKANDILECKSEIMPDEKLIEIGCHHMRDSAINGMNSYNIIPDLENDYIDWNIARMIRDSRYSKGCTLSLIAGELLKDDRTISNWEMGRIIPTSSNVIRTFEVLDVPLLRTVINFFFDDIASENIDEIRNDVIDHFKNTDDEEVRKMAYVIYGPHGSVWRLQLASWVAYDHLPMNIRLSVAQHIFDNYMIAKATNNIASLYKVEINIELLTEGVRKGRIASVNGMNKYT